MLNLNEEELRELEKRYKGIIEQIDRYESAELPACPKCQSSDMAQVGVGVIGRTINIAAATTKFHLTPNGADGKYFCNSCRLYSGKKMAGRSTS